MFSESEIIMEVKNLTKIYPKDDGKKVIACNNINLQIEKGKTFGIVGESGSGK